AIEVPIQDKKCAVAHLKALPCPLEAVLRILDEDPYGFRAGRDSKVELSIPIEVASMDLCRVWNVRDLQRLKETLLPRLEHHRPESEGNANTSSSTHDSRVYSVLRPGANRNGEQVREPSWTRGEGSHRAPERAPEQFCWNCGVMDWILGPGRDLGSSCLE